MKETKLKSLAIFLALIFVLVGCQGKNNPDSKQTSNQETQSSTEEPSKETANTDTQESTNESSENSNDKEQDDETSKNIITNIANLFEKYNSDLNYKNSSLVVEEPQDINQVFSRPNGVEVAHSKFVDNKFNISYTNNLENSESAFENYVNKLADIIKGATNIDPDDFRNKAIAEFKNSKDLNNGIFQYEQNLETFFSTGVQWGTLDDKELLVIGNVTSVEKNNEYKDAYIELASEYLNKGKELVDQDKSLTYYIYQMNTGLDMFDAELDSSQGSESNKDNLDGLNNGSFEPGVIKTYMVSTLSDTELFGKNKDEVYKTTIRLNGAYELDLNDFDNEFDKSTTKLPDEVKSKLGEMKTLMKKQYETKTDIETSQENMLEGKGFVFMATTNVLAPTDMDTYLVIYTDKDGNLIDQPIAK